MTVLESKVPLRISLAGGGSDVEPFLSDYGGSVLAFTINLFVIAKLELSNTPEVELHSIDSNFRQSIDPWSPDSELLENILSGCLKMIPNEHRQGFRITVKSPVPPRSGLGASSAIILAVLSLIYTHLSIDFTRDSLASDAYVVEREFLGIPGGCQDQFVCSHGGLKKYSFSGPKECRVETIAGAKDFLANFEESSVLVWTGISRNSNLVLDDQILQNRSGQNVSSLIEQKNLVNRVRDHIQNNELIGVARVLSQGWELKRNSSTYVSSKEIDDLYLKGMELGALGGKLLGAGGGGFFLFTVPKLTIDDFCKSITGLGFEVVKFLHDAEGVTVRTASV